MDNEWSISTYLESIVDNSGPRAPKYLIPVWLKPHCDQAGLEEGTHYFVCPEEIEYDDYFWRSSDKPES